MISAIVPTLNSASGLRRCLESLSKSALVSEFIVSDGGSRDATQEIAESFGAKILNGASGRGRQLAAGAKAAHEPWLLFIHSDTFLAPGWEDEVQQFLNDGAVSEREAKASQARAAAWTLQFDDDSWPARLLAAFVALRCRFLGLPYGDQGLLISSKFYNDLGGYSEIPLMEDVELVRKIGRRRLTLLKTPVITSAERYRRDGYILRPLRNALCLFLYFVGAPPGFIRKIYG